MVVEKLSGRLSLLVAERFMLLQHQCGMIAVTATSLLSLQQLLRTSVNQSY